MRLGDIDFFSPRCRGINITPSTAVATPAENTYSCLGSSLKANATAELENRLPAVIMFIVPWKPATEWSARPCAITSRYLRHRGSARDALNAVSTRFSLLLVPLNLSGETRAPRRRRERAIGRRARALSSPENRNVDRNRSPGDNSLLDD